MPSDILHFINEHSYLLAAGFVLIAFAIFLSVRHAHHSKTIWLGATVVFAIIWLLTRTGTGTPFTSIDQYESAISSGQLTLVEFYSDY